MTIEELQEKYGDVEVYVIENESVGNVGFKDSFKTVLPQFETLVDDQFNDCGFYMKRCEAEIDPTFRQIIPYCLVKFEDYYFVTKRLDGDSRLIGKTVIGIGGHIERPIENTNNPVSYSLHRELEEELNLGLGEETVEKVTLVGVIKSDASEVDSVHLGLIYIVDVGTWDITVKETEILEGLWVHVDDLKGYSDNWETWSKICIEKVA